MADYRELVKKYTKRRHDTLIDSVTAGISVAGQVTEELGVLEDTGVLGELAESVAPVLPFAVIGITEGANVMLGKKTGTAGAGDAIYRMAKTGAAIGIGSAVVAAGAGVVALPAVVGARLLIERYRGKTMTGYRVSMRTRRLRALAERRKKRQIFAGCSCD